MFETDQAHISLYVFLERTNLATIIWNYASTTKINILQHLFVSITFGSLQLTKLKLATRQLKYKIQRKKQTMSRKLIDERPKNKLKKLSLFLLNWTTRWRLKIRKITLDFQWKHIEAFPELSTKFTTASYS